MAELNRGELMQLLGRGMNKAADCIIQSLPADAPLPWGRGESRIPGTTKQACAMAAWLRDHDPTLHEAFGSEFDAIAELEQELLTTPAILQEGDWIPAKRAKELYRMVIEPLNTEIELAERTIDKRFNRAVKGQQLERRGSYRNTEYRVASLLLWLEIEHGRAKTED